MSFNSLYPLLWIIFEVNSKYYIVKTKDKENAINANGRDLIESVERYLFSAWDLS